LSTFLIVLSGKNKKMDFIFLTNDLFLGNLSDASFLTNLRDFSMSWSQGWKNARVSWAKNGLRFERTGREF
jgi:hypothetical protein